MALTREPLPGSLGFQGCYVAPMELRYRSLSCAVALQAALAAPEIAAGPAGAPRLWLACRVGTGAFARSTEGRIR